MRLRVSYRGEIMRLQSVILPDEKQQYAELYYRGGLTLSSGGKLTLDTYFNSFAYSKYLKYTNADIIVFSCRFRGKAQIELCVFDGKERVICSGCFIETAELSVDISLLPERGFLYPKFTALTDFAFESGEYCSECTSKEVSCCIAICTYKREHYVLKNVRLMRECDFTFLDHIFVIDNGNTLDRDAMSDDFVSVLANRNYGGSGGFTRGLIEALDGGYSHVILMDDDVEFHPEILERMTVFISVLKPEYTTAHFSAAMLSQNIPYIQFEMGADWDGLRIMHGGHIVDTREPQALLDNLDGDKISYGAWWCFLLPVSDIIEYGLPYPFFIKMDDVEYGMRTCAKSHIITMNGIAVRHEDFDNKYSMHLEYYLLRNQFILNSVQNKRPFLNALFRFLAVSFKHLVLYRYDNIPILLRAVDDYLAGVDRMLTCDEELLNRELISAAPKLKQLSDIPQWSDEMRFVERGPDHKVLTPASVLTLAGHIIPAFMLKKEVGSAPLSRAGAFDMFCRREVVQYQLGGDTGIVTRRSFRKFVCYSFRVFGKTIKLLFCFNRAKKSYQQRKNEITSETFWRGHLGI